MISFFRKPKKMQYKAFAKNGVIAGIYNSKEHVEKDLKNGYIASYTEVLEQEMGIDGKFYDKGKAPKHLLFKGLKDKIIISYYRIKNFLFPMFKFLKPSLFQFFLIIFAALCGLAYLYASDLYSILKSDKDVLNLVTSLSPAVIGLFSILIAMFSIIYTQSSLKQQREQWLEGEYIKREAEILLEFRNAFADSQESANWFLHTLLRPRRFGNFTPTHEQLTIKIEVYCKHFNNLNNINRLYNKNQFIFRKYDIDESMVYIEAILNTIVWLDGKDMVATFHKKDETGEEYILNEYGEIAGCFITHLDFNKFKHHKNTIEKLAKETKDRDNEKQLSKYIEEASSSFGKLMFKLDELTTYYNGSLPNKLKIRQMTFFQDAEEFFKSARK